MPVPLEPRRTALLVWAALVGGCLVFAGVTVFLRSSGQLGEAPPNEVLAWLGLALPVLNVALSFSIPALVRAPGSPDEVARTRFIVAWAMREGAALFATVVFLVCGDAKAVAGFAISLAALVATGPTEDRWRAEVEAAGGTRPPPRMVR